MVRVKVLVVMQYDIFELIMQHKLEENNGIIDAAIGLNNIADGKAYYPYITTRQIFT